MSNFKGKKNNFSKDKKYNSIALTLNSFNYFGDLSPKASAVSTDIGLTRPAIGLEFGHRFGPRYTLRAAFTYGGIRGDDFDSADPTDSDAKYRYVRNLQFRNRIKDLTIVAVFDLFKNEASYISRVQWTPYAFLGITAFHHNPQAFVAEDSGLPEAGTWVDLQPLGTEGQYAQLDPTDVNYGIKPYKLFQIAIPFGIGVRYRMNQVFDIGLEFGVRYTFTDYLDDVSQNYVDLGVFNGNNSALTQYLSDRSTQSSGAEGGVRNLSSIGFDPITYKGRDNNLYEVVNGYGSEFRDNIRGRSNNNDVYYVTTLKLSYIIGATFTKAKFR